MFATLAWTSLIAAFGCALLIAVNEARHPQKMWIMNLVSWSGRSRRSTSASSPFGSISALDGRWRAT